ncbi:MAG TPA: hypothetical protein VIQ74_16815 [Gemmatimonadaceae bacterium]
MKLQLERVLVALALTAAAACGREAKAVGDGPYAKQVADAIPSIEKGTGLRFKTPPVVETRTKAQVRSFLEQRFSEDVSDAEIEGQEIFYSRLGLIPDTMKLRRFLLDLLTEQVAGFYDPKTKVLYVVDGAPPEQVGFVVSHELIHALQDQYTNLDSIQDMEGNNDRSLAAQAVFEGQAMLVPIEAALGKGVFLPGGWERVREMIRQQQANMPIFSSAPFLVQETLIFPYLSGAEFMRRFQAERPGKSPFGKDMPTSTEQILHEKAYFGATRDDPIEVTLPAPATGSVIYSDNMGEFETRLFLFQHLQDQNDAVRGAAGWDGDRYSVIRTPRGDGIAWLTVWDSAVDAAEFGSYLEEITTKRFRSATSSPTAGGHAYRVGDRTITVRGGEVQGRSSVLYTDLPAGINYGVQGSGGRGQ